MLKTRFPASGATFESIGAQSERITTLGPSMVSTFRIHFWQAFQCDVRDRILHIKFLHYADRSVTKTKGRMPELRK